MMHLPLRIGLLALASVALTGAADDRDTLTVRADAPVAMTVNGVDGRVRIDPSAVPRLMCNPDFAVRAKIVAEGRAVLLTDPADVVGSYGTVAMRIAGRALDVRANWLDGRYVEGADCVIAPGMIGVGVVRFEGGSAARGERTVAMPLNPGGATSPDWNGAAATAVRVGDRDISVGFSFLQPDNSITASAALRIADGYVGRYAGGPVGSVSVSGRERQVRRMVLQKPLAVGPLSVTEMQVRVSDWGSAGRIKPVGTIDPPEDPNDVKVVARFEREETFERLMLGREQLRRCSSITIDFRAREIRLACAPA